MAGPGAVVVDLAAIRSLAASPEVRRILLAAAEPVARDAAGAAPKRTGAGAASISAEMVLDGGEWVAEVSWDKRHYYLGFQDMGTRFLPARRFLEIALDQHAHL